MTTGALAQCHCALLVLKTMALRNATYGFTGTTRRASLYAATRSAFASRQGLAPVPPLYLSHEEGSRTGGLKVAQTLAPQLRGLEIRCKFPSSNESFLSSDPTRGGKRDGGKYVGGRSA